MKVLFLILAVYISTYAANIDKFAKETGFYRDFNIAITKAKAEDKPLMLVLGADYCPWCRKFEKKTLNNKLIKIILDKELVTVVVDKKFDKGSFPAEFETKLTPRVFFINPCTEKSFYDTVGYIKKSEFKKNIQAMKKLYKGKE